jgi:hypothetical protein
MFCGLPDVFDPLIISIAVTHKGKSNSEDVRTTLLQDEYRRIQAASKGASGGGDSTLTVRKLDKKTAFELLSSLQESWTYCAKMSGLEKEEEISVEGKCKVKD